MADRPPDLIQRAAARLRKAVPAAPEERVAARPQAGLAVEPTAGGADFLGEIGIRPVAPLRTGKQYPSVSISPTNLAHQGIQLPSATNSRTLQEFRAVRREVLANVARSRATLGDNSRIVLITSATRGDGKTFTAINLALALAYEKDTRVLLMDGDAYRQSVLEYLGIEAQSGWLDFVEGNSAAAGEAILRTNIANLSVLPAGRERPEIPELMSSSRMGLLLGELAREDAGRIVVIDSVPCLASIEPSVLAGLAGQTLFVVAAHKTGHDEVDTSLRLLKSSPSVNLLLNKAHPALVDQFKAYGYGYGYGPQQ